MSDLKQPLDTDISLISFDCSYTLEFTDELLYNLFVSLLVPSLFLIKRIKIDLANHKTFKKEKSK